MKSLENKGEGVDHHSFCDMIINVEKKQVSKSSEAVLHRLIVYLKPITFYKYQLKQVEGW